jgi:hypothetical protein
MYCTVPSVVNEKTVSIYAGASFSVSPMITLYYTERLPQTSKILII